MNDNETAITIVIIPAYNIWNHWTLVQSISNGRILNTSVTPPWSAGSKLPKSVAKKLIASTLVNTHEKNRTQRTAIIETKIENKIFVARNENLLNFVNEIDFMNEVLLISSNEPPKYSRTAPTIPIVIDDGTIHPEGNRYPRPTNRTRGITNIDIEAGDLNKVLTSCINRPNINYHLHYKCLSSYL